MLNLSFFKVTIEYKTLYLIIFLSFGSYFYENNDTLIFFSKLIPSGLLIFFSSLKNIFTGVLFGTFFFICFFLFFYEKKKLLKSEKKEYFLSFVESLIDMSIFQIFFIIFIERVSFIFFSFLNILLFPMSFVLLNELKTPGQLSFFRVMEEEMIKNYFVYQISFFLYSSSFFIIINYKFLKKNFPLIFRRNASYFDSNLLLFSNPSKKIIIICLIFFIIFLICFWFTIDNYLKKYYKNINFL